MLNHLKFGMYGAVPLDTHLHIYADDRLAAIPYRVQRALSDTLYVTNLNDRDWQRGVLRHSRYGMIAFRQAFGYVPRIGDRLQFEAAGVARVIRAQPNGDHYVVTLDRPLDPLRDGYPHGFRLGGSGESSR